MAIGKHLMVDGKHLGIDDKSRIFLSAKVATSAVH